VQREFIENLSEFVPADTFLFTEDIDKWLGLLDGFLKQADMNRMKETILARLPSR